MWLASVSLVCAFIAFLVFVLLYFLKTPEPLATTGCDPGECPVVLVPEPRTEEIFNFEYEAGQGMRMQLDVVDDKMRMSQVSDEPLLFLPTRPTNGIQSISVTYIDKASFSRVRPTSMHIRGTLIRFVLDEPYEAGTFEANPTVYVGIENLSMRTITTASFRTGVLEPSTFGEVGFPGSSPTHPCEARAFDMTFDFLYSESLLAQVDALTDRYLEIHVGLKNLDRFTMPSGESSFFMHVIDCQVDLDFQSVTN